MKKPHNVRVLQYFFTESHVKAMEKHDPSGTTMGTVLSVSNDIKEVSDDTLRHGVTLTVETLDDKSKNQPYSFKVVTYGVFQPERTEDDTLIDDYRKNVAPVSMQILLGAAREHLAGITARGPWGTFIASTFSIPERDNKAAEAEAVES